MEQSCTFLPLSSGILHIQWKQSQRYAAIVVHDAEISKEMRRKLWKPGRNGIENDKR